MRVQRTLTLTAVAASLILVTSGFAVAQQSSPRRAAPGASMSGQGETLHEIKDNNATAPNLNINRKDLAGMTIYGSDGKKIGGVDKVLGDSSNQVKAVTADVGGFLGVGSREVIIPVDKLKKGSKKDTLQTSMTKDQLQNLAQWENSGRNGSSVGGSSPTTPSGRSAAPRQSETR